MLQPTIRLGIEIDCFNCGGTWLNRGEVEKMLKKSAGQLQNKAKDKSGDGGGFLDSLFNFTK